MTLPATKKKKRVTCKSHADFKYVRNSPIQDKLIILHVKQIDLVAVWGKLTQVGEIISFRGTIFYILKAIVLANQLWS